MAKSGISQKALETFIEAINQRRDEVEEQYDTVNDAASVFINSSEGEMIEAFKNAQNIMSAQHYVLYNDGFTHAASDFTELEENLVAIDKLQGQEGAMLSV